MTTLIASDFNMDYLGNKNRSLEKSLSPDLETSLNLKQIIKAPTRSTARTASTIDLIFLSNKVLDSVQQATPIDYNVSDHDITCLIFKKELIARPKTSFTFRFIKNFKLAILHHRLPQVLTGLNSTMLILPPHVGTCFMTPILLVLTIQNKSWGPSNRWMDKLWMIK